MKGAPPVDKPLPAVAIQTKTFAQYIRRGVYLNVKRALIVIAVLTVVIFAGTMVYFASVHTSALPAPPSASPAFTNLAVQATNITWRRISAQTGALRLEGVEAAERINELLMRRSREQWEREHSQGASGTQSQAR